MDEKKEKGNWHLYISLTEVDQIDDLMTELEFVKKMATDILKYRSDRFGVEIKGKKWSDDPDADILDTTIKY